MLRSRIILIIMKCNLFYTGTLLSMLKVESSYQPSDVVLRFDGARDQQEHTASSSRCINRAAFWPSAWEGMELIASIVNQICTPSLLATCLLKWFIFWRWVFGSHTPGLILDLHSEFIPGRLARVTIWDMRDWTQSATCKPPTHLHLTCSAIIPAPW